MSIRKYNKPIIGTKYGQWTVISNEIKNNSGKARSTYYKVKCDCGKEGWRAAHTLVNGITKYYKSCCKCVNGIHTYINQYFVQMKRRAKDKNLDFNIKVTYLQDLLEKQKYICTLSGLNLELRPFYDRTSATASIDRIDNNLGYIEGNLQWVHKHVNMMKGVHSQQYFIELCTKINNVNKIKINLILWVIIKMK